MTKLEKYPWYEEYEDTINNLIRNKTMQISADNILIQGEEQSQFIPFLIDRKYKGMDLINQAIRIHFVNANDKGDYSEPINVEYDESTIRFCWLVPKSACLVKGDLQVEIEILGFNSKDEVYLWKSHIYYMTIENALNVGEGIVIPDENWYASFTRQVDALSSRIAAITDEDVEYGAEIRDARVDDQNITHATMNDRFQSDLNRMYAKKNYELINMRDGSPYTCWIGTNAQYEALTDEEKALYVEYKITDEAENVCGLKAEDVFELDEEDYLTPVVKMATDSVNGIQFLKINFGIKYCYLRNEDNYIMLPKGLLNSDDIVMLTCHLLHTATPNENCQISLICNVGVTYTLDQWVGASTGFVHIRIKVETGRVSIGGNKINLSTLALESLSDEFWKFEIDKMYELKNSNKGDFL